MTHDELLAKIDKWFGQTSGVGSMTHHEFCVRSDCDCALIDDRHALLHNAFRAVVELHKPVKMSYATVPETLTCSFCSGLCHSRSGLDCDDCPPLYPCLTIRAIEKELA